MPYPADKTNLSDANDVGKVEEKTFVYKDNFSLTGAPVRLKLSL